MEKDIQERPQGADGDGTGLSSLFGQQRGNQASQPASVEPGESDGSPQYATREELKAAIEEAKRVAQSISDKAASTSKKAYQAAMQEIATLKGLGVAMTPDIEQKIRDKKLDEMMKLEGGEPTEPQQPTNIDNPQMKQPPAWLDKRVNALITEAGFSLIPQDPEMQSAGLTPQLLEDDPMAFYEAYRGALQQKRERIARGGGQPSRAAVPGIGTGGQAVGLEANYRNEIKKNVGNKQAIKAIKQRYREMGFNPDSVVFDV